jgi:hypothetical protein
MTNTTTAEVVARRTTFDGVTIFLHADGSVSDRLNFFRGKLPAASMWRAIDDASIYTHAEVPAMIRDAKAGKWSEAWLAGQVRRGRLAAVPQADRVYIGRDLANGMTAYMRVR